MKQYLLTIAMLIMAHAQATLAKPILDAAASGDLEKVRVILDDTPGELEARGYYDTTPLHWAVHNNHTDVVLLLLERRADVNARDNDDLTPLHWAAFSGCTDMVRLLIAHGVTVGAGERDAASRAEQNREAIMAMLTPEGIAQIHRAAAESYKSAAGQGLAALNVVAGMKNYKKMFDSLITVGNREEIDKKEAEAKAELEKEAVKLDKGIAWIMRDLEEKNSALLTVAPKCKKSLQAEIANTQKSLDHWRKKATAIVEALEALRAEAHAARAALPPPAPAP